MIRLACLGRMVAVAAAALALEDDFLSLQVPAFFVEEVDVAVDDEDVAVGVEPEALALALEPESEPEPALPEEDDVPVTNCATVGPGKV